eukprot:SAG11_NODE_1307_length_5243_cov_2.389774_2_plen_226_part_00
MYLHAPANATVSSYAKGGVTVGTDGEYMVMVRYEALYRFETPFSITIEQDDQVVFTKLYGRRSNYKVWGQKGQGTDTFSESGENCKGMLNRECVWQWGSVENMVWEGVNATVNLTAGSATVGTPTVFLSGMVGSRTYSMDYIVGWAAKRLRLLQVTIRAYRATADECAATMLGYCQYADRNVDAIMLMPNRTDIGASCPPTPLICYSRLLVWLHCRARMAGPERF